MKKQSENTFTQLNEEQVKNLTSSVKETLAAGLSQPQRFTAIDMWNIQRRGRTMMQRRSFI